MQEKLNSTNPITAWRNCRIEMRNTRLLAPSVNNLFEIMKIIKQKNIETSTSNENGDQITITEKPFATPTESHMQKKFIQIKIKQKQPDKSYLSQTFIYSGGNTITLETWFENEHFQREIGEIKTYQFKKTKQMIFDAHLTQAYFLILSQTLNNET